MVSDAISFVQIMKTEKGGTPFLFPNEKPRATDAKDGDAGWAVDRLAGNKNADYQIGNDGKEVPGWARSVAARAIAMFAMRRSRTEFA